MKEKEPEKQDLQKIISAINWAVIDGGENGKLLVRHILWLENELKKAREK